ncbi:PiggyBac transposable element-derived protein 4 [Plakobranchus ocellatus]|uniref:PiggyBac transposable element-derived protein 4 n=1 Tax=Plakobranchus ocellatus TaxID=259542 RepID=A0AAV4BHV3_9GAST|nr:PiggyBac transposable element-derived protein 4 [Plakobranchus ocellatus]
MGDPNLRHPTGESGPEKLGTPGQMPRSSRVSVNQARNLILEWIGDNDRSTSSDEETGDTRQEVELDLDFDSDTDESSDDDSATPSRSKRPCKGKASAAVRAKGNSKSRSSTYRVPQAGDSNVDLINNSDRAAAASNEPEWLQIEHDETRNNFRFAPPFTGVCDQVNENFTPFDFLSLLVDNEVKETLIKSINEFAERLSLDEMIIGFKGRWAFKQFNSSKPKKYHIKTFGLCDSATGFYTTKELVTYLLAKQFYQTGNLNTNRKGFPPEVKNASLAHREIRFFMNSTKTIECILFRDKKAKKHVTVVSTQANTDTVMIKNTEKPAIINDYNHYMNGCDKLDQMVNYFGMQNRRAKKWWRKLFFWILEIAQYNAYIFYVLSRPQGTPKSSLKNFKRQIVKQMLEAAAVELPNHPERVMINRRGGRPSQAQALERLQGMHLPLYDVVCSTTEKRVRTHFYCSGCSVKTYLHPKECFYTYHTKVNL